MSGLGLRVQGAGLRVWGDEPDSRNLKPCIDEPTAKPQALHVKVRQRACILGYSELNTRPSNPNFLIPRGSDSVIQDQLSCL